MAAQSVFADLFPRDEHSTDAVRGRDSAGAVASRMNWSAPNLQPSPEEVRNVTLDVARKVSWRMAIASRVPMGAWPAMIAHVPENLRAETVLFLQESEHRQRVAQTIARYSPPVQKGADTGPVSEAVKARIRALSL